MNVSPDVVRDTSLAAADTSRGDRRCAWCNGGIHATARRDALTCSKSCRQARHRARIRRLELDATDRPLRLAYADPPYPGHARLYRGHADFAGEVDHVELLSRLAAFDGWALSTSAAALPAILAAAVSIDTRRIRVAAWLRGAAPHPTARVLNAWEPVVYAGGRRLAGARVRDAIAVVPRRRPTLPTAVVGMKPPAVCAWIFGLLGALPGDSLADLYPGSGIVGRCWSDYTARADPRDASRKDG